MQGTSGGRAAVLGVSSNPDGSGVEGSASGGNAAGVFGVNDSGPGAWGRSATGFGVFGESPAFGVRGPTTDGAAVYGLASGIGVGVFGQGLVGVFGQTNGFETSQAIRGDNGSSNTVGYAGAFLGRVGVFGTLFKEGGAFKIDHPLDPANKYLNHSFIESPDMKNLYDGVVTLDENGEALVELPEWFEALNRDFRYQLTCIGGHAPVFIADEIDRPSLPHRRRLAGPEGVVAGHRRSATIRTRRTTASSSKKSKPRSEKGTYMYPDGYGMPRSMGMAALLGKVPLDGGPLPTRPGASASERGRLRLYLVGPAIAAAVFAEQEADDATVAAELESERLAGRAADADDEHPGLSVGARGAGGSGGDRYGSGGTTISSAPSRNSMCSIEPQIGSLT